MNYVLDTNIILIYLRDEMTKQFIEEVYGLLNAGNTPIISAVTIGEIRSIAIKNAWGDKRIKIVEKMLNELVVIDVRFDDLFDAYAEIDTFSQGKFPSRKSTFSARNMGKNDLWIAATTYITDSKTIDNRQRF
ncbi:MAG: PIN domain-containing protein [Bacteroidota bacterium]